MMSCTLFCLTWIFAATANTIPLLYASRLMSGIGTSIDLYFIAYLLLFYGMVLVALLLVFVARYKTMPSN